MRTAEIPIPNLKPIDGDNKSKRAVNNYMVKIRNEEEVKEILVVSDEKGKYFVLDGHHRVLAYKRCFKIPKVSILENDDDLRLNLKEGAINTTNFWLMLKRAKRWYEENKKYGIDSFKKLEEMMLNDFN